MSIEPNSAARRSALEAENLGLVQQVFNDWAKRDVELLASYVAEDLIYPLIAGAPDDARAWDHVWRVGLGASYFINRHAFLNASYNWDQLETNVDDDGFEVNTVWLILALEY